MPYATSTSPWEKQFQELEAKLDELNISITAYGACGLKITFGDGKAFWLEENGHRSFTLPRSTDDEKLILAE